MDTSLSVKSPISAPKTLYRNYAENKTLAAKALKQITPMLDYVRRNRLTIDKKALRRYNQWALITDDRFYQGRANTYIPAVRRGVERLVTTWIRETFPNDEWWDVQPTDPEFAENVAGMKALMDTQLKRRMHVKRKARPAYRQLALYGISPIKVPWRTEEQFEHEISPDPENPRRSIVTKKRIVLYDDPDMIPVDFFSFGVYPMTVMDVSDARLVYEDMIVDLDELRRDKTNYGNLAGVKSASGASQSGSIALQKRQQRLQQLGITEDELVSGDFTFLTECYLDFDFEDKYALGAEPAIVTLAYESIIVRLQRNAYRRAPYFVMKDAEMVSEFWAHSRTEATDRLQITLNDHSNQDLDASAFANNPIVVIDPNYVDDYQSIAIYPAAKIPAPPDAVKFDRPPDAAFSQKEKIAFMYSMILENLGAPMGSSPSPAASGQPRGARTFGGMQLLQALAGSEAKEVVEFQEDAVWEPMLQWVAWLNANFMTDERTLRTAGRKGVAVTVNRETFKGDCAYEWLGTSTVQTQTVRSAQMLVAMNILRGIGPQPNGQPNIAYVFKEWWKSQGLKGVDEVWVEPPKPIPAEIENQLVFVGRAIEVSPADNDAEHIASHSQARGVLSPDSPEHQRLLLHEQAHYHSFLMKQQAMAMQQAAVGAIRGAVNGSVGPTPKGARAGQKPTMGPQSGMGPVRALMDTPGGA